MSGSSLDTVEPLPCRGAGIVLRRLCAADLAAFQAYRADAELGRYQGWSAVPDAEALKFLEEMRTVAVFRPGEWTQIGIAEPDTLTLLGDIGIGLAEDSRHAEIGFTLARHAQGRGLATAAVREAMAMTFRFTAVERVFGIADVRNVASTALLRRVGMRQQEERAAVLRGEPCTEAVHVMTRARFVV